MKRMPVIPFVMATLGLLTLTGCFKHPDDKPYGKDDNSPPHVFIAYPPGGTVLSGETTIRALATDDQGIMKVVLYVDGLPVDEEKSGEPYEFTWSTLKYKDSTDHIVTVRAYDLSSNVSDSDPVNYRIDNSGLYPTPVHLIDILYKDSAFRITWNASIDKDFFSYTLNESFDMGMMDWVKVYSTEDIHDTVFVTLGINAGEVRYYQVVVTNTLGLSSPSGVKKAIAPPGTGIPMEGLVAWYPFNGNADDASGNGHDGIVYNAVPTLDRYGNTDQAYDFGINEGTIAIQDPGSFNNMEAFTIAAWIYRKGPGYDQAIISKVDPQRDFLLKLYSNGQPNVHFAYDPGIYFNCTGPEVMPADKWLHLAAAWTGNSWKLYVDGGLVQVSDYPGEQPPWTGMDMAIGSMSDRDHFQGCIDEVMIYNRALTDQEIVMLSNY